MCPGDMCPNCSVYRCAVKRDGAQPVAVYPWHCLVPFLASSSTAASPQRHQHEQLASTHPADMLPPASSLATTTLTVPGMYKSHVPLIVIPSSIMKYCQSFRTLMICITYIYCCLASISLVMTVAQVTIRHRQNTHSRIKLK